MRNIDKRNFGLRSRDMGKAAKNAQIERSNSYGTVDTNSKRFDQFLKFMDENHHEIKDLIGIEKSHVLEYAEELRDKVFNENMKASYAQNLLSAAR